MNNGYRYASTQPLVVDPDRTSGRNKHRRIHWGTVDENNKFHPNNTFLYADVSERRKLIFPDDWDMSEVASLPSERKAGRPSSGDEDSNKLYGDIWLLEQIADKTGIRKDLEEALGGNREMADAIITLAMYHITTGNTFNRVAHWQRIFRTPCQRPLTSPDITHLTQSIKEQHRMDLFRLRAARTSDGDLCAVDSTTRSAYGSSLADVKWGRTRICRYTTGPFLATSPIPGVWRQSCLTSDMPVSRRWYLSRTGATSPCAIWSDISLTDSLLSCGSRYVRRWCSTEYVPSVHSSTAQMGWRWTRKAGYTTSSTI